MRAHEDVIIRPLRNEDDVALAAIYNTIYSDEHRTPGEVRQDIARVDPRRYVSEYLVAERRATGEVVGVAFYRHVPWAHHPAKYNTRVQVHPQYQGRGIGSRLMREVLDRLNIRGAERVTAGAREDLNRGIAFLGHFGFVEHVRDFKSHLNVSAVDLLQFGRYAERMANLGISITTLEDELQRDPDCLKAIYQVHSILDMSTPQDDPDPPTPLSYEDFVAQEAQHPRTLPDAFFLAKRGALYVGESYMKRSDGDPGLLHQDLTGVIPVYQGQGIATALKLRTLDYAQRRRYREIRTTNSSRNAPMLAINSKLGFVPQPAWIGFLKTFD